MREPTFLLLCALADAPKHGYAIRQDVERSSDGAVMMRTGTLYAALERLTEDGLVARVSDEVVDGRTRHYYRLTEDGAGALREASRRRAAHARLATRRLKAAIA